MHINTYMKDRMEMNMNMCLYANLSHHSNLHTFLAPFLRIKSF